MLRPHIVILGAGFGGTYVAKRLESYVKKGELDVTIVNKTNYFLFTPLLHEVATGSLTPTSVAEPLREIFVHSGVCLSQGKVESIDQNNRRVHISANGSRHTIPYDYLVIATGAESNYYNIPGADAHTFPLKDLLDAARIRTRIIDSFEKAIVTEDPNERSHLLSFVVVGGGPTGVETAAELKEFTDMIVSRYYYINNECAPDEPRVALIHTGTELLPQFDAALRRNSEKRLRNQGVNLIMGKTVSSVSPKGLTLADGTLVPAHTIIWAAGVKAIIPHFELESPPVIGGRLAVDKYFRVNGDERVFAIGDVAGYVEEEQIDPTKPTTVPMLAQATVQEAKVVAKNLLSSIENKPLTPFKFRSKGNMVSVGQWFAVGEIFSVDIAGRLTWLLWRTVYLLKFASWKKRIRIAFEWTFEFFYPRDTTKLT